MGTALELVDVGVRYGRRAPWVLRGVRLALGPGDVVEVTGRNGAGKSSLLRVLAGVRRASAGQVRGRPAVVGWAPERFPAQQPFTAGAYLLHAARVRGLRADAAEGAVRRETERLHLEHLLDTRLAELSGGSAQKVGIAQALLVPPDLLVLDEPWAALDAEARAELPQVVRAVAAAGGCVVVTDHGRRAGALPLTSRWQVAGGAVETVPATAGTQSVVEVTLAGRDADDLVRELRARGLDARRRVSPPL